VVGTLAFQMGSPTVWAWIEEAFRAGFHLIDSDLTRNWDWDATLRQTAETVLVHASLTAACLTFASWRTHQLGRVLAGLGRPRTGGIVRWRPNRMGSVWESYPMLWKEVVAGNYLGWPGMILAMVVGAGFYWDFMQDIKGYQAVHEDAIFQHVILQFVLFLALDVLVVVSAVRNVFQERESGTWSLLRLTSLDGSEVMGAKLLGTMKLVALLMAALLPTWIAMFVVAPRNTYWIPGAFFIPIILAIQVAAFGLSRAIEAKTSAAAIAETLVISASCLMSELVFLFLTVGSFVESKGNWNVGLVPLIMIEVCVMTLIPVACLLKLFSNYDLTDDEGDRRIIRKRIVSLKPGQLLVD
jgi:hypothetical protein